MNIPELPHSGAKNSIPSRGVVTVTLTNKSSNNTENVGHNPMPAPYVSPSPFKGTTPNQTPATPALVVGRSDMLSKLEVESVDSEVDYSAHGVQESLTNNQGEEKTALNQTEDAASKNLDEEMVASEIRLSLTTEGGLQGGVEIYDYTKRGRCFDIIVLVK